jgi:hypothetical protein
MARPDFVERLDKRLDEIDEKMIQLEASFLHHFRLSYADPDAALERFVNLEAGETRRWEILRFEPETLGGLPERRAARENALESRAQLSDFFHMHRKLRDQHDELLTAREMVRERPTSPDEEARQRLSPSPEASERDR